MKCQHILRECWFLSFLLAVFATPATAAVFERDLASGSGDGLLTFDDVNQREWLDLSQSLLIDLGETDTGGEFTFDFDRDVVPEVQPGGLFEGFTIAKSDEVLALAESAGIVLGTLDFDTNQAATAVLIDLLEPTAFNRISTGLLDEQDGQSIATAFFEIRTNERAGLLTGFGAGGDAIRYPNVGVMLYRAVPEPATATLIGLAAFCIFVIRLQCRAVESH